MLVPRPFRKRYVAFGEQLGNTIAPHGHRAAVSSLVGEVGFRAQNSRTRPLIFEPVSL